MQTAVELDGDANAPMATVSKVTRPIWTRLLAVATALAPIAVAKVRSPKPPKLEPLPKAADAARRVKTSLQNIFEGQYSWDLEHLKKQNLGKAAGELAKYGKAEPSGWVGVTPFGVAYVTQNALGGHAIPVDCAVGSLLELLGIINMAEAHRKQVPGMERAISKSKGIEFASLLQQFAAEFQSGPQSTKLRSIVLEINPAVKDQLPKRKAEKKSAKSSNTSAPSPQKKTRTKKAAPASSKKKSPAKPITKKKPR